MDKWIPRQGRGTPDSFIYCSYSPISVWLECHLILAMKLIVHKGTLLSFPLSNYSVLGEIIWKYRTYIDAHDT